MTSMVHLKRITLSLLLISILLNCDMWNAQFGREEINVDAYVTLQVAEFVEGQEALWVFAQLPDSSKLNGFLPSDTLVQVSFRPDVPGEYDVMLQVSMNGETEETSYFYEAVIAEDSTLVNSELPEHLLDSSYNEDIARVETPEFLSVTDEGDQRQYLSKVVTPGQTKAPKQRSAVRPSESKKGSKAKSSRGNLIPRAAKTYTIQVSSWPSLEEAQAASNELLDVFGIDSYIQRAFFKDKDEIYYRLRIGNFLEEADAKAYALEIQSMTSLPVWVDYIRKEM